MLLVGFLGVDGNGHAVELRHHGLVGVVGGGWNEHVWQVFALAAALSRGSRSRSKAAGNIPETALKFGLASASPPQQTSKRSSCASTPPA